MSFKEKLFNTLGTFGMILFYILLLAMVAFPCAIINCPWWLSSIFGVVIVFNMLGDFVSDIGLAVIWILSFIEIVSGEIGGFEIFYFVIFGIYVLTTLLPNIIALITAIVTTARSRND